VTRDKRAWRWVLRSEMVRIARLAVSLAAMASAVAGAEPIPSTAIRIMDGDTIEARGVVVRLVGYDTPETDRHARCAAESDLGAGRAHGLQRCLGSAASILSRCGAHAGQGRKARPNATRGMIGAAFFLRAMMVR
jgi:endonuclease YncB( thermonuclease family)